MNWDQIEAHWRRLAVRAKSRWPKLTDDDLGAVSGDREALVGKIEERYAIFPGDAETQVDDWVAAFGDVEEDEPVRE